MQAIRSHVVVQGERFGDLIASLHQMTGSPALEVPEEPAANA